MAAITVARNTGNTTRNGLVNDVNAALATAGVTDVVASLKSDTLVLTGQGTLLGASIAVKANVTDTAHTELGLGIDLTPVIAKHTGIEPVPYNGQLTSDAHFRVSFGNNAPVDVTIAAAVTQDNVQASDLIDDINAALINAGLTEVEASLDSESRLVLETSPNVDGSYLKIEASFLDPAVTDLHLIRALFPAEQPSLDENLIELTEVADLFDVYGIDITGATIITHGFQLLDSDGDALKPLADAIYGLPEFNGWLLDYDVPDGEAMGGFDLNASFLPTIGDTGASGDILLLFDWAAESNELSAGWTEAAGDALFNMLVELGVADLGLGASNPDSLHFIAHSFGSAVNSEAIERLAAYDIPVDQATFLDPHDFDQSLLAVDGEQGQYDVGLPQPPLGAAYDDQKGFGVTIWDNISFADVYYETRGLNGSLVPDTLVPESRPIPGAYNVWLNDELPDASVSNPYDVLDASGDHSFVWSSYYMGSVLGDTPVGEPAPGIPVDYLTTGYAFSYILGGETIRPLTDNFYALDQDHEHTPEFLWDHANNQPNATGLADLGETEASLAEKRWLPEWDPLSITNGDFENPAANIVNSFSHILPGWSHHGGYGEGHVYDDSGNHYLQLDQDNESRTHNRIYIDSSVTGIQFDLWRVNPGESDLFQVRLGDVILGQFQLDETDAGFQAFELPVDLSLTDQVNTLSFEILSDSGLGTQAVVRIDNINLTNTQVVETSYANAVLESKGARALQVANGSLSLNASLSNVQLNASATVAATDINALAKFAMLGIDIAGGSASASAGLNLQLRHPDTLSSTIGFDELPDVMSDIGNAVAATLSGNLSGSFTNISVQDNFLGTLTGNPTIVFDWSDITNPAALNLVYIDFDALLDFESLDSLDLQSIFQSVSDFFDTSANSNLGDSIPLLDKAFNEIAQWWDSLTIDSILDQLGSSGLLQTLEQQIEAKLADVFQQPGDYLTLSYESRDLRFAFNFAESFSPSINMNFNLGDIAQLVGVTGLDAVGNLVDVQGSGALSVNANTNLNLVFGVDLTNPGNPQGYLHDSSLLTADLLATGTGLNFSAALGPLGIFIKDGTATIDNGAGGAAVFALGFTPNAVNGNRYHLNQLNSSIVDFTHTAEASATLPVYYPTQSNRLSPDISFITTDILNMNAVNTSLTGPDLEIQMTSIDLVNELDVLIDALDYVLTNTQNLLNSDVFSQVLPFIGDQLKDAAGNLITDVKDEILAELRTRFASDSSATAVRQALFAVLGSDPGGLNLLDPTFHDSDGDPGTTDTVSELADITYDPTDGSEIKFKMRLVDTLYTENLPLGFDLGLPGLGLEMDANSAVQLDLGYQYDFGFGVNLDQGFYLDTSSANEFIIDLNATIPGFSGTASLGFLQLDINDRASDPSSFVGQFGIDLMDADNKLYFNEMAIGGFGNIFDASLSATADINLDLVASIAANASFPSLLADLDIDWAFDPSQGLSGGVPTVAFGNVKMDLGEFFSDFVQPIISNIESTLKPLEPVIDLLTTPLPIIKDFFDDATLLDLARLYGYDKTADFIEAAADVLHLIDGFGVLNDSVYYDMGGFDFTGFDLRSTVNLPSLDISGNLTSSTVAQPSDLSSFINRTHTIRKGGMAFPIIEDPLKVFGLFLGKDVDFFTYTMPTFSADFSYWEAFGPVFSPPPIYITLSGGLGVEANFSFGYDTYGIRNYVETGNELSLLDGFYIADPAGEELELYGYIGAGGFAGLDFDLGFFGAALGGGIEGKILADIGFDLDDPNNDQKVRGFELLQNLDHGFMCVFDTHGSLSASIEAYAKFETKVAGVTVASWTEYYPLWTTPLASFDYSCAASAPPVLAELASDGTLTLNMGPRAALRLTGDITDGDEEFTITRLSKDAVLVSAFEHSQIYGGPDQGIAVTKIIADGGQGNDSIIISDNVQIDAVLYGGVGADRLEGGGGNDTIEGGAGGVMPAELQAGESRSQYLDILRGNSGDDVLYGHSASGVGDDAEQDLLYGGDGNDRLYGGLGDDTLYGDRGNDIVYGQNGQDKLNGGLGDDVLYGGQGNDFINGSIGQDQLFGDAGDDILDGGAGNDILEGNAGSDFMVGGSGADLLYGHSQSGTGDDNAIDTLFGDRGLSSPDWQSYRSSYYGEADGADTLYGQGGNDLIYGEDGNDELHGGNNQDEIFGGRGDDIIYGDAGNDTIYGESGDDWIEGNADVDLIYGGIGVDIIYGNAGADEIWGNSGNDIIYGGTEDDLIYGNSGDDEIHAGSGADNIFSHSGIDIVYGGADNDYIDTGTENDFVYGEAGDDIIYTHSGDDYINAGLDNDTVYSGSENDTVYGDAGDDLIYAGIGDDYIDAGAGLDTVYGESGSDRIYARAGNDVVRGGSEDDLIYGEEGLDQIWGDDGNDQLFGGDQEDTLYGGLGQDLLVAGAGTVNRLYGDEDDDTLIGSDEGSDDPNLNDTTYFGDILDGGTGDDNIQGLGGADTILGGTGNDIIDGGNHGDLINGDTGNDVIYGGSGNDEIHGGAGHDQLYGEFNNDTLFGDTGDDILDGGTGTDILAGGDNNDTLYGGGGVNDQLAGEAGDDVLHGSNDGADILVGGSGRDHLFGHAGNDTLQGEAGDDILEGGLGDDLLEGGADSDVLVGGEHHDTLFGHSQSGAGDDNAIDYLYGDLGTNGNEINSGADTLDGQGGNDYLFGEGDNDQIADTTDDWIDYGAGLGGVAETYVAPTPTPDPTVVPPGNNSRAQSTLPTDPIGQGRWHELGATASGLGLSGNNGLSIEPSLASNSTGDYAAWADSRNGNFEIYLKQWNGTSWEEIDGSASGGGISDNSGTSWGSTCPEVVVDSSGNPIVVWRDDCSGNEEIYVKFWNGTKVVSRMIRFHMPTSLMRR